MININRKFSVIKDFLKNRPFSRTDNVNFQHGLGILKSIVMVIDVISRKQMFIQEYQTIVMRCKAKIKRKQHLVKEKVYKCIIKYETSRFLGVRLNCNYAQCLFSYIGRRLANGSK